MNTALICLHSETKLGKESIQSVLSLINKQCRIEKISNVYKLKNGTGPSEHGSELWVVIKIQTGLSLEDLKKVLDKFSKSADGRLQCQAMTLTFNDIVWLQPDMPIPNPALIDRPVILKCAMEVWDSYQHPILSSTLSEIGRKQQVSINLEFYAQGKSLLE